MLIAGTAGDPRLDGQPSSGQWAREAVSWDAIFLVGDALALLLVVLFWATLPSLIGASTGAKIGTFLALFVILAQGAGALLALARRASSCLGGRAGAATG